MKNSGRSGPGGIFPLRFRGQAIFVCIFHLVESARKLLHLVPAHLFHRTFIAAHLEKGGIVTHYRLPLFLGDLRNLEVKRDGYGGPMIGFPSISFFFLQG